jgi:hypothetical protein
MPTSYSPPVLPKDIEQLLKTRAEHVAAIGVIDATLGRVRTALGGGTKPAPVAAAKPVKAPVMKKAPVAKPAPAPMKKPTKGFPVTAADLVLTFVKNHKNPTTQEIGKHWKSNGRLGTADNTLSLLTKAKKLKRNPLPAGQRGSRYTLP